MSEERPVKELSVLSHTENMLEKLRHTIVRVNASVDRIIDSLDIGQPRETAKAEKKALYGRIGTLTSSIEVLDNSLMDNTLAELERIEQYIYNDKRDEDKPMPEQGEQPQRG